MKQTFRSPPGRAVRAVSLSRLESWARNPGLATDLRVLAYALRKETTSGSGIALSISSIAKEFGVAWTTVQRSIIGLTKCGCLQPTGGTTDAGVRVYVIRDPERPRANGSTPSGNDSGEPRANDVPLAPADSVALPVPQGKKARQLPLDLLDELEDAAEAAEAEMNPSDKQHCAGVCRCSNDPQEF